MTNLGDRPVDIVAVGLTATLLEHARRDTWDEVTEVLGQIADRGDHALYQMILGLAGVVVEINARQQGVRPGPDRVAIPTVVDRDSLALVDDVDTVPPGPRWAVRVIAARAAVDHAGFDALLDSVPPESFPSAVLALIEVTAATVNTLTGEPSEHRSS